MEELEWITKENKSILDYFTNEKILDCFESDKSILDDLPRETILEELEKTMYRICIWFQINYH